MSISEPWSTFSWAKCGLLFLGYPSTLPHSEWNGMLFSQDLSLLIVSSFVCFFFFSGNFESYMTLGWVSVEELDWEGYKDNVTCSDLEDTVG